MAREIFLTGATGFVGRRLLCELLSRTDCQVCCLVRSQISQHSLLRALSPSDSTRIRFVLGDVTHPGLGLSSDDLASLAASVNEIWHLAASTEFDEAVRDQTFAINVGGVANLIAVALKLPRLSVLYHMSSAYVCGRNTGHIPEGPFEATDGFKNPYEESKYNAELLLRESGLPIVIIRPSIIMGDSRTGDNGGDTRVYYGYVFGLLRAVMHRFGSVDSYLSNLPK